MSYLVPMVIKKVAGGERSMDIYSRLLEDRIVFVGGPIDDDVANIVIAQLLFLQLENSKKDIDLYLNTPGGYVTAGMAIYDTMQFLQCDVATCCIGQASSIGAMLLAAGKEGKRRALPNSRIMLHQPYGGAQGTASDISIQAAELKWHKQRILDVFAEHTGNDKKKIAKDIERDFFMSPEEGQDYGIIDEIIKPLKGKK